MAIAVYGRNHLGRSVNLRLFHAAANRYLIGMNLQAARNPSRLALGLCAAILVGLAVGLAFASWIEHGAQMFLALAESGLAWCF